MPTPDVWITPITPAGPTVAFGLAGAASLSQFSSGSMVWSAVDRPRRKPFLEFTSAQLLQLQLPLLLDAADRGESIEHAVSLVAGWIRPTPATGEPPIVGVTGPVDQSGITRWVVQTIAWGTDQQRRRDGALTRTDLTVTLLEYTGATAASATPTLAAQLSGVLGVLAQSGVQVPNQIADLIAQLPTLLAAAPPSVTSAVTAQLAQFIAAVPNNPAGALQIVEVALPQLAQILPSLGGGRAYTVREGDTLARIAARELGDYRRAGLLAALNGIRDPASIRPNQRILLP